MEHRIDYTKDTILLRKGVVPQDKFSSVRSLQCQAEQLLQAISKPFLAAVVMQT